MKWIKDHSGVTPGEPFVYVKAEEMSDEEFLRYLASRFQIRGGSAIFIDEYEGFTDKLHWIASRLSEIKRKGLSLDILLDGEYMMTLKVPNGIVLGDILNLMPDRAALRISSPVDQS